MENGGLKMENDAQQRSSILQPPSSILASSYRGRLAPSPTGLLHLGHARTFWVTQERTRAKGGT